MRKRLLIGLALLGLAVLAVVWNSRTRSRSPLYQGKTIGTWAAQFDSVSPQKREESAAAFRAMGATAVPELIRLLESRDPVWRKALWKTALKLPPRFRPMMVRHSRVPDERAVHRCAARALAVIGLEATPAIPALGRMLRSRQDEFRWDAAAALGRIGTNSLDVLTEALRDANPNIRCAAIDGLAQLGAGALPAIPALIEALKDQTEAVRNAAIACLGRIGPSAAPSLAEAIERERGLARQGAAKALMSLGASRRVVAPALLQMIRDEDPAAREQAIATLAAIHAYEEPAVKALAAALRDPVPEVRRAAAKGLGEVNWKAQPAVPALIESLKDQSSAVRASAARTLGLIRPPTQAAIEELARVSEADPDLSVRAAAQEALAKAQAGQGR